MTTLKDFIREEGERLEEKLLSGSEYPLMTFDTVQHFLATHDKKMLEVVIKMLQNKIKPHFITCECYNQNGYNPSSCPVCNLTEADHKALNRIILWGVVVILVFIYILLK